MTWWRSSQKKKSLPSFLWIFTSKWHDQIRRAKTFSNKNTCIRLTVEDIFKNQVLFMNQFVIIKRLSTLSGFSFVISGSTLLWCKPISPPHIHKIAFPLSDLIITCTLLPINALGKQSDAGRKEKKSLWLSLCLTMKYTTAPVKRTILPMQLFLFSLLLSFETKPHNCFLGEISLCYGLISGYYIGWRLVY